MLHTVHWRDGDTGEYFYFNENEVDAMVGRTDWNAKEFDVYQRGSGNWSGSVILWKSDSQSAAHGRRKEGHAANQWAKGDIIDLQVCKRMNCFFILNFFLFHLYNFSIVLLND